MIVAEDVSPFPCESYKPDCLSFTRQDEWLVPSRVEIDSTVSGNLVEPSVLERILIHLYFQLSPYKGFVSEG